MRSIVPRHAPLVGRSAGTRAVLARAPVPWLTRGRCFAGGAAIAATTVGLLAVLALGRAGEARATGTLLATFNTRGTYLWTVPAGVHQVTFDVFGASGGHAVTNSTVLGVGG